MWQFTLLKQEYSALSDRVLFALGRPGDTLKPTCGKPVLRGKWQDDETSNPLSIVTTQRYIADDDDDDARDPRAWDR